MQGAAVKIAIGGWRSTLLQGEKKIFFREIGPDVEKFVLGSL